jgi:hypothetical protein
MIRTITMGSHISVQGTFVRSLPNGEVVVKVGSELYAGKPVLAAA